MRISILDVDRCENISRIIMNSEEQSQNKVSSQDLLYFLPREIFNHKHEDEIKDGNFRITYNDQIWLVPPYFIGVIES